MQTMRSAFHEIVPHCGRLLTVHVRSTAVCHGTIACSNASDDFGASADERANTISIRVQGPRGVEEQWPISNQKDMDALMSACKCKGGSLTTLEPPFTSVKGFRQLEEGCLYKAAPPTSSIPRSVTNIIIGERTSDGKITHKEEYSVFGQRELDRVCQLYHVLGLHPLDKLDTTLTRINQLESDKVYVLANIDGIRITAMINDIKSDPNNDIYSLDYISQAFVNACAREARPGHPVLPFWGKFKYDNTSVAFVEIDAAAVVDDLQLLVEAKKFASSAMVAEAAKKLSNLKGGMTYNAELRSLLAPVKTCYTMLVSEAVAEGVLLQDVVRTAEDASVGLVLPNSSNRCDLACVVEAKELQFP